MTQYKHIVQVHPVENGEVNLYKVTSVFFFDTKEEADNRANLFNTSILSHHKAVYCGRVNLSTGELE